MEEGEEKKGHSSKIYTEQPRAKSHTDDCIVVPCSCNGPTAMPIGISFTVIEYSSPLAY